MSAPQTFPPIDYHIAMNKETSVDRTPKTINKVNYPSLYDELWARVG